MIIKVRSASWASCLLLMVSSSLPRVVQFPLFEHCFKVSSGQQSSLQSSPVQKLLEVEINLRVKVKSLSHVRLSATPWMVTYQAPQSMGFSRQEYWSGLPFPSAGDLPDPRIELTSPASQDSLLPSHQRSQQRPDAVINK